MQSGLDLRVVTLDKLRTMGLARESTPDAWHLSTLRFAVQDVVMG